MFKRNFLLIALVMALMAGCAGLQPKLDTDANKLAFAEIMAQEAADAAVDLYLAGTISKTALRRVAGVANQLGPVLDLAHSAVNGADFPALLAQVNTLILEMQREVR